MPTAIPETKLVGLETSAIVPVPLIKLQAPVPIFGKAAERLNVSAQIVASIPALGITGNLSTVI